ncbi:metal-dependent hydrolase [Halovivax limisalsi]|uniref:metal-dependent hydrolase n=1 Tax=Halovivax limisalsi TaxID=1453760 RepID=UPI001FFD99DD|nr:metal-dependent hydrolase [Halovivax limisalsi]
MWPLGHLAVAYILYAVGRRYRRLGPPTVETIVALAIGSQFPDLVDKPLAWRLEVLPTGRTLAHSLLLLVPLAVAVFLVARRVDRPAVGVAFAVGSLSHTLVDVVPSLWGDGTANQLLWPVLSVEPYEGGPPTIVGLLLDSLGQPYFLVEFLLGAIALGVWLRDGRPGLAYVRDAIDRPGFPTGGDR